MRKIRKNILCLTLAVMILTPFALFAGAARKEEARMTIPLWQRGDIVLKSEKQYENPYTDVDVDATFVHESGEEIHLYGFWNGGDGWRSSFSTCLQGSVAFAAG